jgi:superfamily I DNA/RNA helicase
MHRVMELADREEPYFPQNSPVFYSLIPLAEVIGEIFSKGPMTKTVMNEYGKLIRKFDSEFNLLLNVPTEEISERYSPVLGEAVKRIRDGKVTRKAGFDGEFGIINVFDEGELKDLIGQYALFKDKKTKKKRVTKAKPSLLEFTTVEKDTGPEVSIKSINKEQEAAVTSDARHIVVTAGPGTGKTFTLISRIKKLVLEKGIDPGEIAAITFTNRAAEEMRDRLSGMEGVDIEKLFIGTFHAFCLNLLSADEQGLVVVDEAGSDKIIATMHLAESSREIPEMKESINSYYRALESGSLQDLVEEMDGSLGRYLQELEKRNGIDLNGIIPRVVYQLKSEESFLNSVNASVKYLFIDEFQDLNRAQYELVRTLASGSAVFAIGDPDQAIYGFRGSSPEFFHHFVAEFDAKTVTLGRNYRSAKKILEAASAVISCNHETDEDASVELVAEHSNPGSIDHFQAVSPQAEAEYVVRRIEELLGGISHFSIDSGRANDDEKGAGISFRDIAVLYRLTQQSSYLREALERRGIPFQVVNVRPFYMNKEVSPLYYWIRAASDSETTESRVYFELLRTFPGVGESTLATLERQLPLGGYADFFASTDELVLSKVLDDRIDDLQQRMNTFRTSISEKGLSGSLKGILSYLRVNEKNEGVKRFMELCGSFGSDLSGFADYLSKNETATVYDEKSEAVSLMTLHGAKGLEFPVVFITGMEEGIFPCQLYGEEAVDETSVETAGSLQEERRLFYVGMTRAQERLILTSSVSRPIFGSYKSRPVSRFVNEVPEALLERVKQEGSKRKKTGSRQMKLF